MNQAQRLDQIAEHLADLAECTKEEALAAINKALTGDHKPIRITWRRARWWERLIAKLLHPSAQKRPGNQA